MGLFLSFFFFLISTGQYMGCLTVTHIRKESFCWPLNWSMVLVYILMQATKQSKGPSWEAPRLIKSSYFK